MESLENRKFVLLGIFLAVGLIYLSRLFFIQVLDDKYQRSANNQTLKHQRQHAARGLITDRNGEIMVYNQAAYDIVVVPKNVRDLDTAKLCKLLGIEVETARKRLADAREYSRHKASIFEKQITSDAYARIMEKLYLFPGFDIEKRLVRSYPAKSGAHVLGYISEVSPSILEQQPYYRKGDMIGTNGIEKHYEKQLRGQRGLKILMKDVNNVIQGSYKEGKYDTLAVAGKALESSLDKQLQAYGEYLMGNKKGSIVAIEPSTGEVLALISSPSYDPNLLVGRERSKNYAALAANDSLNPLFNRATMSEYMPGSIFKMVQALIGLQDGILTPKTTIYCDASVIGDHVSPGSYNLYEAIKMSSNQYFYYAFKRMINRGESNSIFKDSEIGLGRWEQEVRSFGLGSPLPIELEGIKGGLVPGPSHYDKLYGKGRWAFSTIYSISIGQGEVTLTPLQMANLACIIANKGYYYNPHLVRAIGDEPKDSIFLEKQYTVVEPRHFQLVIDAMQAVVEEPHGTARRARIDGITVCGKTGTVENSHGEDHSVFMCFAPKENPKIALAVYVENAGFGGTWAAPISALMIEKYLRDSISNPETEQRIVDAVFEY